MLLQLYLRSRVLQVGQHKWLAIPTWYLAPHSIDAEAHWYSVSAFSHPPAPASATELTTLLAQAHHGKRRLCWLHVRESIKYVITVAIAGLVDFWPPLI